MAEKQAAGKLADLTIPELKLALKARKKQVGGKKGDLVDRLQAALAA